MTPYHYSTYHYRIKTIHKAPGYTWIFLPGGPGLGSEYLHPLCDFLKLPGTTLLVDFPKDGTNNEGIINFSYWKKGLIDLVSAYKNPILVVHSFSGMFALDTPELAPLLSGLVLMNTTTSNTFFEHVNAMREQYQLPDLVPEAAKYHLNPSTETYRNFWQTYKHYCFTAEELSHAEQMMPLLAFNHLPYQYAIEHFFIDYQYRWVPEIPTLTIAGEQDFICPPDAFTANEEFKQKYILNRVIPKAGHCSWILKMEQVKHCFEEFLSSLVARNQE